MENRSTKLDTGTIAQTDANTVLAASDLEDGTHFKLKKNGKNYTVHCQVMSKPSKDEKFDRMHYTLAVCNCKMYVFDAERLVIACR